MRSRSCRFYTLGMVLGVMLAVISPPAMARSTVQTPRACAPATSSINQAVNYLQRDGVLERFAAKLGIFGVNGSVALRMNRQLVIGTVADAVAVTDTVCGGKGGSTQLRRLLTLFKGERVGVKPPPSIGLDACQYPGQRGCVPGPVVRVQFVFPTTSWDLAGGSRESILVQLWVHKKPGPPIVPPPTVIVTPGPTTTTTTTTTTNMPLTQQGSCNVLVVNGSNNVINACITTVTITCNGVTVTVSGPSTTTNDVGKLAVFEEEQICSAAPPST